jgi:hypothetical protein
VCVSVDRLRVQATSALDEIRVLLADPQLRERLGITNPDRGQLCAPFEGESP